MIIKYDFLSKLAGDMPEVEVDDDLGKVMEQMALDEFNLDRAKTRRHYYMSQLEENGHYIADDSDPLNEILKAKLHEALMASIEKLKPKQKEPQDLRKRRNAGGNLRKGCQVLLYNITDEKGGQLDKRVMFYMDEIGSATRS